MSSLNLEQIRAGTVNIDELRKENLEKNSSEITYIGEPISYEEFFVRHLVPNRPCVFGRWATVGWRSRTEWVTSDGLPNSRFLKERFGTSVVPVADCNQVRDSAQPKQDFTVEQFLQYLQNRAPGETGPPDETGPPGEAGPPGETGVAEAARCLYLKDWHFTRSHPDYVAYTTPPFFRSDWLNEFWDGRKDDTEKDDYRFVYYGPKGSWTPLHADVLRSYSWSANVCGTKRWWVFPPGAEENLKDTFGQLAYDLRSDEVRDVSRFPHYPECIPPLEVTQRAGEIIFIPSGWHHQVFNVEDTISINHNWLNGCSVDLSWAYVKTSLQSVQREIADCRDMEAWNTQCQLILKACSGIDYPEFYRFLHFIATNRLHQLNTHRSPQDFPNSSPGLPEDTPASDHAHSANPQGGNAITGAEAHAVFDLFRILAVLEDMLSTEEFTDLDHAGFKESPQDLYARIQSAL